MNLNDLISFIDLIDNIGFHKDAQILDSYLLKLAAIPQKRYKRVPNYGNISLVLSPIIAGMLIGYMNSKKQDNNFTINVPIPEIKLDSNSIKTPEVIEKKQKPIQTGDYSSFVDFVNGVEGGVSNRKKQFDPGGLTNMGITQKTYDTYRAENKLKPNSVINITEEERDNIIKKKYWNPIKGDQLPRSIALVLADWKFNGGKPVRAIQKILNVPLTGRMDDQTIESIWAYIDNDPKKEYLLAKKLISSRQKYLESIKTIRNKKRVPLINYNRGWYNRLNDLHERIQP